MRREGRSLRPPIFPEPFPVWRGFRVRQVNQGAIRAGIGLESWRHFRTIFGRVTRGLPESISEAKTGDILERIATEHALVLDRARTACMI